MHLRPLLPLLSTALIATTPLLAQGTPAVPVVPMAADAHPSFAVATVKPHDPNSRRDGIEITGDHVAILNESVVKMMVVAYAINKHQVLSAPDWAVNQSFDIEGKPDIPGEPSWDQVRLMLQKLLADRFGLQFHRDRRELPVYALQVTKGGPKLSPAADPTAKPLEQSSGRGAWSKHTYTSTSMAYFIDIEQFWRDRPIVDQTGLIGRYDFSLRYTYNELNNTDPDAPPEIFTAIQEQLGLKLQPTKAPVDVLVVDQVQHPSEN